MHGSLHNSHQSLNPDSVGLCVVSYNELASVWFVAEAYVSSVHDLSGLQRREGLLSSELVEKWEYAGYVVEWSGSLGWKAG